MASMQTLKIYCVSVAIRMIALRYKNCLCLSTTAIGIISITEAFRLAAVFYHAVFFVLFHTQAILSIII
jgi:hypothetical protein